AAVWIARPSSELGAHQEELLHSLPYPQGEDRESVEPWAHDPVDGINDQQAEDKWSLEATTPRISQPHSRRRHLSRPEKVSNPAENQTTSLP
ncbi:Hypothetical predicted protein, partial [Pelobates cultripes]